MAIGAMGIMQVNNAKDIMNTHFGKRIFLIGVIIALLALGKLLRKNFKSIREEKKIYLKYVGVWIAVLLGVLIVFK
jgi:uncharacterized membrane protein YidH (DUF202 family)